MNLLKQANSAHGGIDPHQEVRCAVRFPLALPVSINTDGAAAQATTLNISASGVLMKTDRELKIGSGIEFSMLMPKAILGTAQDVMVQCIGRVVRCNLSQKEYFAAATIDDYKFFGN